MSVIKPGTFQRALTRLFQAEPQGTTPPEEQGQATRPEPPAGPSVPRSIDLPVTAGNLGGDLEYYFDKDRGYSISDIIKLKQSGEWAGKAPSLTSIKDIAGRGVPSVPDIPPPANPKVPKYTEMVETFATAGITVYPTHDAVAQPKLEVNSPMWPSWIVTDMNLSAETGLIPFPILGTEGSSLMYHQSRSNMGHWNQPLTSCKALALKLVKSGSPLSSSIADLLREMISIAREWYFGTGSVSGQAGRLSKVIAISHATNKGMGSSIKDLTVDELAAAAERVWPMGVAPEGLNLREFRNFLKGGTLTILVNGKAQTFQPFKINASSDAGFPWESNATRGETLSGDIYLADALATDCDNLNRKELSPTDFANRWGWSVIAKMKAKAEVYKRSEINTKTRNIFVTQAGCMMPAQTFFRASTVTMPHALTDDSSKSLIGTNLLGGGLNSLLSKMINGIDSNNFMDLCFYSDNLFILVRPSWANSLIWISLDGEKMEASNNKKIVGAMLNLMGTPIQHAIPGWMTRYLESWYTNAVIDQDACIGKTFTQIPGMLSGVQGTAYVNNFHMALLAAEILESGSRDSIINPDLSLTEYMMAVCDGHGLKLKIEAIVGHTSPGPTLKDCYSDPHTPKHYGRVSNTDLLGWSTCAVKITFSTVWCAVLARERLLKALLYRKSQYRAKQRSSETGTSQIGTLLLDLVMTKVLYVIGGWAYEDISLLLRAMVMENLKAIAASAGTGEEAADLRKLSGEMITTMLEDLGHAELDSTILHTLTDPRPATLEEALNISLDHDVKDDLIWWAKNNPVHQNRLPEILTPESIVTLSMQTNVDPGILLEAREMINLRAQLKQNISLRSPEKPQTSTPAPSGPPPPPGTVTIDSGETGPKAITRISEQATRASRWLRHGDRSQFTERWEKMSKHSRKTAIRHIMQAVASLSKDTIDTLKRHTPPDQSATDVAVAMLANRYSVPWSTAVTARSAIYELMDTSSEEEEEPPHKRQAMEPPQWVPFPDEPQRLPYPMPTLQHQPPAPPVVEAPPAQPTTTAPRPRKRKVMA